MTPAKPHLTPLKGALQFSMDLDAQGVTGPAQRAALNSYLSQKIDAWCKCGEQLLYYQAQGKLCEPCRLAYLEALENKQLTGADSPVEKRMFDMGVVPRYRHCTLSNWAGVVPNEKALMDWATLPTRSLVLWGPATGTGKTHLATAILYTVSGAGRTCRWFSATDLARTIQDEEFDPSHPTLSRFERCGVALLDDWGREHGAAIYAKEKIASALESRYAWKRPTIVTMNMTPEQAESYDTRTWSRLREGFVSDEFAGPDARLG